MGTDNAMSRSPDLWYFSLPDTDSGEREVWTRGLKATVGQASSCHLSTSHHPSPIRSVLVHSEELSGFPHVSGKGKDLQLGRFQG